MSMFQKKIDEIMKDDPCKKIIEDLIRLQMHRKAEKDSRMLILVELLNLVGLDRLIEIIDLVDGRAVKFPNREEFKDTIETVLCYYYKNFRGYDWKKIGVLMDEELVTKKVAANIRALDKYIGDRVKFLKGDDNDGK